MTEDPHSTIRTTIVQRSPAERDVDANEAVVRRTLERARTEGADLVVFPELFLSGYYLDAEATALTAASERALTDLLPATEGMVVVLGAPTPAGEDGPEPYNSAVVLEDGSRLGAYHKTHPFDTERETFTAGASFPTFDTAVGTLGVQICYDVEFPEVSRQLTLNGADLLVTISANMRPCIRDQALYHGTRAIENGRPHVLCNRVGTERDLDFFGESGIMDHRGRRILSLGRDRSETTAADIPRRPDRSNAHDYLADRRPAIYSIHRRS